MKEVIAFVLEKLMLFIQEHWLKRKMENAKKVMLKDELILKGTDNEFFKKYYNYNDLRTRYLNVKNKRKSGNNV